MRTVTLNDGTTQPALAWGNMGGRQKALSAGTIALQAGIRHIDSAQVYGTEAEVPLAIKAAGLKREDVYVCTKVNNVSGYDRLHSLPALKASVDRSLKELTFIPNLILIHNPYIPQPGQLGEFWTWLEGLVEDGTLKGCSLGLSNFRPVDVEEVMKVAKIKPVVNQIEYHPYVSTHVAPLLDIHKKYNIITQAYASLVPVNRHPTGGPLKPILTSLASKLTSESKVEVDEAGVLLLWIFAKGAVAITSSGDEERIRKMADLEKVRDLTKEEVGEIDEAGGKVHYRHWTEHMMRDFPDPDLPADL